MRLTNCGVLLADATGEAVPSSVVIPVDLTVSEKAPDNVTTALLDTSFVASPRRYPISEFTQFWIVLKRTLLFSRRDWVRLCHILLHGITAVIKLWHAYTHTEITSRKLLY
jgi:hypothetical protein